MRAARTFLLAGASLALLAGCTARTSVDLTVLSAQTADVTVAAEFTDEAAEVLAQDDDAMDELIDTFQARTGVTPDVTRSADRVRVAAQVDYSTLEESAAVTGVSSVRLTGTDRQVQAAVELVPAPDLLAALGSATASQPDAAVLASTMAKSTQLVLTVRFPGGLAAEPSLVGLSARAVSVDGDTVTVVRTAADAGQAAVVVSGDPRQPTNWALLGGSGAVLAVAAAAVVAHRRDRAEAESALRRA